MNTNRIAYLEAKIAENVGNWTEGYFRSQLDKELAK